MLADKKLRSAAEFVEHLTSGDFGNSEWLEVQTKKWAEEILTEASMAAAEFDGTVEGALAWKDLRRDLGLSE